MCPSAVQSRHYVWIQTSLWGRWGGHGARTGGRERDVLEGEGRPGATSGADAKSGYAVVGQVLAVTQRLEGSWQRPKAAETPPSSLKGGGGHGRKHTALRGGKCAKSGNAGRACRIDHVHNRGRRSPRERNAPPSAALRACGAPRGHAPSRDPRTRATRHTPFKELHSGVRNINGGRRSTGDWALTIGVCNRSGGRWKGDLGSATSTARVVHRVSQL